MKVWVIWASNEESSEIVGVASTRERAIDMIACDVDTSQIKEHGSTVEVPIDGYSSFYLVSRDVDSQLTWFEKDRYIEPLEIEIESED